MAEQKLKTSHAPVANVHKKSVSSQLNNGFRTQGSVPRSGDFTSAHRTVSQSSTYKTTSSVSGGFSGNTTQQSSSYSSASKTINTGYGSGANVSNSSPTPVTIQKQTPPTPIPAQRQVIQSTPLPVQTARPMPTETTARQMPIPAQTARSMSTETTARQMPIPVQTARPMPIETTARPMPIPVQTARPIPIETSSTGPSASRTNSTAGRTSASSNGVNPFNAYQNKKVSMSGIRELSGSLKYGGGQILGQVQSQAAKHDDLATQSINATIEDAKKVATVFKGAQMASAVVTPVAAKATVSVAKQAGLTAATAVQSYGVMKGLNISPVSKQGLALIKANAIDTGLAGTTISRAVGGTANVVRGTALVGVGVTKQVGLTAVTMAQSYDVIKGLNISPISKQALGIVKANAIGTGLANTQISKVVTKSVTTATHNVAKAGKDVVTGIKTGAKGVYQVATTVGLATVTVARAYDVTRAMNTFPVSREGMRILKTAAVQTGLAGTQISQAIVRGAGYIQTQLAAGANTVKTTVANGVMTVKVMTKTGIQTARNAGAFALHTIRGVRAGAISLGYVSYQLERFAILKVGQGVNVLSKGVRGVARGGLAVTRFAVPKAFTLTKGGLKIAKFGIGGIKAGSLSIAGILASKTDDMAIQGVVKTMQAANMAGRIGVTTARTSIGVGKGIGKAGIKTIRVLDKIGMTFWQSYYRTNSIKKAFQAVGKYGARGITAMLKNAGGSLVNAVIGALKSLGKKIIIPLLIIIFIAGGGMAVLSAPISLVSSIFSGVFGMRDDADPDTENEFFVEDYLMAEVPLLTAETRQDIADDMYSDWKANDGAYDIVRLKEVGGGSNVVEPTLSGVTDIFYTDAEVVDMLEAVFNVKVLMDYDLSPSNSQAKRLLKNLYNAIFTITTEETMEWCGQDLLTGDGEADEECAAVNRMHAIIEGDNICPNQFTSIHTSQTDAHCDTTYYTCNGHTKPDCKHSCGTHCMVSIDGCSHTCGSDCYKTEYHSNNISVNGNAGMSTACTSSTEHFYCKGYSYCNGHKVNTYTINLDGLYTILNDTFYEPIDSLESIAEADRTDDQKQRLSDLKDYLEIYEIMATEVFQGTFGGGMTMEDLDGVSWIINPGRTPCQAVVDLALSQVGNQGGRIYWQYSGFTKRVSWCACFVNWCMRNTPSATSAYPTTDNNAYCQTVANYLASAGQLGSDYNNIVAGDAIFFDWQCDGHTDHIGIVVGRDSEYVYTVEGNSGDAVKIKKYPLSSSVIYAYGYLNY